MDEQKQLIVFFTEISR